MNNVIPFHYQGHVVRVNSEGWINGQNRLSANSPPLVKGGVAGAEPLHDALRTAYEPVRRTTENNKHVL